MTSFTHPKLIIDAHQDIAFNWMDLGRDLLESVHVTRERERRGPIPAGTGTRTSALPELKKGRVGLVFATLFIEPERRAHTWRPNVVYSDAQEAHTLACKQMDWYRQVADREEDVQLVTDRSSLEQVVRAWQDEEPDPPVGLLVSMEGADPIREPAELEQWYEWGLRAVGISWSGTRYAGGTHEPGPLTAEGYRLLERMMDLNMLLDLSHCAEEAYWQALEVYEGPVIASHSNPRRFLPTDRGLSDEMIQRLVERDGVLGIVLFNTFLKPGWRRGDPREEVPLQVAADAIDHVAQLTGNSDHVAIGSDFDGGTGLEAAPEGLDTVADLYKIAELLDQRGYAAADIERIMSGNWLRILRRVLPD